MTDDYWGPMPDDSEYPTPRELDDGVSCDPVGCDTDARDALRWLTGYGEDWCELLDLPREWAQEVTDARMLAQQEALSD